MNRAIGFDLQQAAIELLGAETVARLGKVNPHERITEGHLVIAAGDWEAVEHAVREKGYDDLANRIFAFDQANC